MNNIKDLLNERYENVVKRLNKSNKKYITFTIISTLFFALDFASIIYLFTMSWVNKIFSYVMMGIISAFVIATLIFLILETNNKLQMKLKGIDYLVYFNHQFLTKETLLYELAKNHELNLKSTEPLEMLPSNAEELDTYKYIFEYLKNSIGKNIYIKFENVTSDSKLKEFIRKHPKSCLGFESFENTIRIQVNKTYIPIIEIIDSVANDNLVVMTNSEVLNIIINYHFKLNQSNAHSVYET
ncbi:hypothetical protein [Metamycoplasma neophronis]|uniref:Uncharacterized protein n=1 Tax=Metamycoplasma neophronis TaxID=872983 RepID=A0ABY2Z0V1_9BACT|nr:hypothetical protein [Metamycoplasma neophronis]TPR54670.1 hypothetical protein FJR74_00140 [Metamycoplasma neophronis]